MDEEEGRTTAFMGLSQASGGTLERRHDGGWRQEEGRQRLGLG
jgi:hypothetical protein